MEPTRGYHRSNCWVCNNNGRGKEIEEKEEEEAKEEALMGFCWSKMRGEIAARGGLYAISRWEMSESGSSFQCAEEMEEKKEEEEGGVGGWGRGGSVCRLLAGTLLTAGWLYRLLLTLAPVSLFIQAQERRRWCHECFFWWGVVSVPN